MGIKMYSVPPATQSASLSSLVSRLLLYQNQEIAYSSRRRLEVVIVNVLLFVVCTIIIEKVIAILLLFRIFLGSFLVDSAESNATEQMGQSTRKRNQQCTTIQACHGAG